MANRQMLGQKLDQIPPFKEGLATATQTREANKPEKIAMLRAPIVCGNAQTTSKTEMAKNTQPLKRDSNDLRVKSRNWGPWGIDLLKAADGLLSKRLFYYQKCAI